MENYAVFSKENIEKLSLFLRKTAVFSEFYRHDTKLTFFTMVFAPLM